MSTKRRLADLKREKAKLEVEIAAERRRHIKRVADVLPPFSPSRFDIEEVASAIVDAPDALFDALAEIIRDEAS